MRERGVVLQIVIEGQAALVHLYVSAELLLVTVSMLRAPGI